jgi:hypothetical protein
LPLPLDSSINITWKKIKDGPSDTETISAETSTKKLYNYTNFQNYLMLILLYNFMIPVAICKLFPVDRMKKAAPMVEAAH